VLERYGVVVHFVQWQAPKNKATAKIVITFFIDFSLYKMYGLTLIFYNILQVGVPFFFISSR